MNEAAVASLSELVKVIAKVEEIDEVTVGFYARSAREAGLVSKKGRGRGAAQMTVTDAANLLIGVNASKLAKDVGEVIPVYRTLHLDWTSAGEIHRRQLRNLVDSNSCFGEHLEHLINLARPTGGGRSDLADALASSVRKADEAFAQRRDVPFPPPGLELQFIRPSAEASVTLVSPRISEKRTDVDLYQIAISIYRPEGYTVDSNKPERQESIIITQRTIFAVAQCLFS